MADALVERTWIDDAERLRNHRRQQSAIETNCGHQVSGSVPWPLGVVERRESTARRAGAAELLQHRLGDRAGAFRGRKISGKEAHAVGRLRRRGARRSHDLRSGVTESSHDCGADTFGAAVTSARRLASCRSKLMA